MTFNKGDSNTVVPWDLTGIFGFFFKDCELSLTPKQEIDRFIYLPKIYCKSPVGYTCCFLFIQKYRQIIIIIIRDNKNKISFYFVLVVSGVSISIWYFFLLNIKYFFWVRHFFTKGAFFQGWDRFVQVTHHSSDKLSSLVTKVHFFLTGSCSPINRSGLTPVSYVLYVLYRPETPMGF